MRTGGVVALGACVAGACIVAVLGGAALTFLAVGLERLGVPGVLAMPLAFLAMAVGIGASARLVAGRWWA